MSTGNTKLMRKMNISVLRNIMKEKRVFKKAELAQASGLSVVTINSLLGELIEKGEVLETDKVAATGGRKAALYKYNASYQLFLAICLFEHHKREVAHISVCNLFGDIIFEKESHFLKIQSHQLEGLIEECLEKYPPISLITIGIPGQEINGLIKIMDFEGLQNENLRSHLERKFAVPVLIENDINVAISGYYLDHEDENNNSIVGIYYPMNNPPGVGVILNGSILKGRNGLVGEVKYLPFEIDWEHFSFQEEDLKQHILKTAVTIGSLYDPDQYVFYGELFNDNLIREIENELLKTFPNIEKPDIVFETNFHENYLRGVIAVSLNYLNREY